MKQTITFLSLVLLLSFPRLYAQDFWETLPFPDTAHVRSMAVNNQGHIFIGAGSNNTIGGVYRSIDGGLNWEFMLNMGDFGVLSIEINTQGIIYAGTNHGFHPLYASYDNGENWEEISLPLDGNVVKILCHDQNIIYVSRWLTSACVLRTLDGGQTWVEIFNRTTPAVEYVKDIIISITGTIYLGLKGYSPDSGGVYKSEDDGATWELCGLFNHMVSSFALNSENDLFAGAWGGVPGLHVLRNGENEWTNLLYGPNITDVAISSIDHIYLGSHGPNGVIRSLDNGLTFEMVTNGLVLGIINGLAIDINSYIYAFNTKLSRSINPLVSIFEIGNENISLKLRLFPNPAEDFVQVEFTKSVAGPVRLELFDLTGRKALENSFQANSNELHRETINIGSLKKGVYIVRVHYGDNAVQSTKLMVK